MHSNPASSARPERLSLREDAWMPYLMAQVLAVTGLVVGIALGWREGDHFRRFFFAYLVEFLFFLAIALGGLFFVILQHLTKAGWSVSVRRIAEWLGSAMPVMAALAAPVLISIIAARIGGYQELYPWGGPGWEAKGFKGWYLQPGFFVGRMIVYLAIWSWQGVWFWKQSVTQDISGDVQLTRRMQGRAPVAMVLFGLALTFAAWDWIMTLDAEWYSTIFGVYYFAGCTLAMFATIIIAARLLQSRGLLVESVTIEHYHDLGKFLFGFTFFWGYIAFSQYVLQWYGNIPDETGWYLRHGASSAHPNAWTPVLIALLAGHLLIPFAGLLSRHVKRSRCALTFWAVWVLVFCWIDIFWLVVPEYDSANVRLGWIDLALFLGVGGVFVSFVLRKAGHDAVRALHDPRLADSLAFENF